MNYKDGRTLKKYYCKDCGKEIYFNNALYGTGLCGSCGKKGHIVSIETKEKIQKTLSNRTRPKISQIMMGSGNHRFKNGKPKCLNCGKELNNYSAKYCWDCYIELGLNKGINAPNYIDGSSRRKYAFGFTHNLKKEIRKRDNYQCQNKECNMTEEEHLIVYGTVLEVHHIDYDKSNHNENNLLTLCKQCNIRANYNRKYWENYFKIVMAKI